MRSYRIHFANFLRGRLFRKLASNIFLIERSRAENAAAADLHHDDGLRVSRYRGRSDETRRLRFRDQAAKSRQSGNTDLSRAPEQQTGAGKPNAATTGRRTLRT